MVPVFNGAGFVAEAIGSILAQPGSHDPEIIVVDDCSTDETVAVVGRFGDRVRLVRRDRNAGVAVARNDGLATARGDLIGFLDADDLWTVRHLEALLGRLDDGSADCARGFTRTVALADPEGAGSVAYQPILLGAGLYRRSLFERIGWFDPKLRLGEDFDFAARMIEAGAVVAQTEDVVLVYRRHANSVAAEGGAIVRGHLACVRNRLRRGTAA
ncbi:glycosyltransferase [Kaistia geumhonensis]|uniref:glycosyltransferase family 2 protein n=1 Tax=Kaistia geumhonensis TaxID=410839 RepID=UPI00224D15FD|nr:glycosyltransferase [Kaistia geumhonensis]MCX5480537.1 glycosyltransferase [Kaistia geumhonensis]